MRTFATNIMKTFAKVSDEVNREIMDNLEKEFTVDPAQFLSMGKATPFEGWKLKGECVLTVCDGRVVYRKELEEEL